MHCLNAINSIAGLLPAWFLYNDKNNKNRGGPPHSKMGCTVGLHCCTGQRWMVNVDLPSKFPHREIMINKNNNKNRIMSNLNQRKMYDHIDGTAEDCISAIFGTMAHAIMTAISCNCNTTLKSFQLGKHAALVLLPIQVDGWEEHSLSIKKNFHEKITPGTRKSVHLEVLSSYGRIKMQCLYIHGWDLDRVSANRRCQSTDFITCTCSRGLTLRKINFNSMIIYNMINYTCALTL